jgi:hypothetical protein
MEMAVYQEKERKGPFVKENGRLWLFVNENGRL